MIKKTVWLLVSCLMVLTLIISSCGEDEEGAPGDGDDEVVGATEPQYGGTITTAMAGDYLSWDPTLAPDIFCGHMMFTHNEYIQGDWTKGPNGSGETDWEIGFLGRVELLTGELAESWEMPDSTTIILHLREGVRYHNRPPVNGRELTAEDAAWSIAKFIDLLRHLWIPIIVIGTAGTAGLIRVMRGCLLDEFRKQYVVTARAKGKSERALLFKYPVRIAINPIVSTIGWMLPYLISGGTITAIVLNLPTTGPLLLQALMSQDMYLAGSFILILSVLTVIGTLISDLLLVLVDPRIRYE